MTEDQQFIDQADMLLPSGVSYWVTEDPCLIAIQEQRPDAKGEGPYAVYLDVTEAQKLRDWLQSVLP